MSSLQIRGSWGYFVLICEWNPHPGPWVSKTQDDTGMVRRGAEHRDLLGDGSRESLPINAGCLFLSTSSPGGAVGNGAR